METKREELLNICRQAMEMLREEFSCSQEAVGKKLGEYGARMGRTTSSKVLNGSGYNVENLPQIAKAVQILMKDTLGMEWVNGKFISVAPESFKPINVFQVITGSSNSDFSIHKMGRLQVSDKVAFFKDAKHEVIEFGVKLNRFTHNLCKGGYGDMKGPISKLLENGVNFKCYMIHWDSQYASLYFNDREQFSTGEKDYAREITSNLEQLLSVKAEFEKQGYPGKFEVYTYNHVPYNYFLIVDGSKADAKMMVSHYIYGVSRNKAPVLQFSQNHDFTLYLHYWDSFKALTKTAKKHDNPA